MSEGLSQLALSEHVGLHIWWEYSFHQQKLLKALLVSLKKHFFDLFSIEVMPTPLLLRFNDKQARVLNGAVYSFLKRLVLICYRVYTFQ